MIFGRKVDPGPGHVIVFASLVGVFHNDARLVFKPEFFLHKLKRAREYLRRDRLAGGGVDRGMINVLFAFRTTRHVVPIAHGVGKVVF